MPQKVLSDSVECSDGSNCDDSDLPPPKKMKVDESDDESHDNDNNDDESDEGSQNQGSSRYGGHGSLGGHGGCSSRGSHGGQCGRGGQSSCSRGRRGVSGGRSDHGSSDSHSAGRTVSKEAINITVEDSYNVPEVNFCPLRTPGPHVPLDEVNALSLFELFLMMQ